MMAPAIPVIMPVKKEIITRNIPAAIRAKNIFSLLSFSTIINWF